MSKWFDVKEYALYKGDDLLMVGTIREIAKDQNVAASSIAYLKTPAHKRKIEKRKNSQSAKILVHIEDDESGLG